MEKDRRRFNWKAFVDNKLTVGDATYVWVSRQLRGEYVARERAYLRWNEGRKRPASDEAHLDNCNPMSVQLVSTVPLSQLPPLTTRFPYLNWVSWWMCEGRVAIRCLEKVLW
jgi:hypothetical protein